MAEDLNHKACVDLLMDEYGVQKADRQQVLDEVMRIWDAVRLPHFVIIRSVRGFLSMPQTRGLEMILERLQTHPPKHKKGLPEYREGAERSRYQEPSYEHQ